MERRSRRAAAASANDSFNADESTSLPSRRSARSSAKVSYQDIPLDIGESQNEDEEGNDDQDAQDASVDESNSNAKVEEDDDENDPVVEDEDLSSDVSSDSGDSDLVNSDDEAEFVYVSTKRGRGRPSHPKKNKKTNVRKTAAGDEDDDDDDDDIDDDDEDEQAAKKSAKKKRGAERTAEEQDRRDRKKAKKMRKLAGTLLDENGKPLKVKDNEIITPDDPKGDLKIDKNGNLLGGRKFKCRTFKCIGKGDKLFMLSTEPARCVGFRDSYLLFQKHIKLFKVVIGDAEKADLIKREIMPASHKSRTIGLVTARSIFKEFGAKIIYNGKQVTDDYYEDKARESGAVEGAPAVISDDPYQSNTNTPPFYDKSKSISFAQVTPPEISWMYDAAFSARQYDSRLLYDRFEVLNAKGKFQKDPYTGVSFVPDLTQSKNVKIKKFNNSQIEFITTKKKLVYDTVIHEPNCVYKTGLKDVPLEIFDDVVSDEVKQAILNQQALESEF